MEIDATLCSDLLRAITDDVASRFVKPDPAAELGSLIGSVQVVAAEAAERMRQSLGKLYPDVGWAKEDSAQSREQFDATDTYWVFDPIDGAYHYLQGLPLWSASLALVREGQTVFGAVYDPALGEMFLARIGAGATLNGAPIRASAKTLLTTAVVGTAVPPAAHGETLEFRKAMSSLLQVTREVFVVRQMGSASLQLAYAAAGRLDAYWEVGDDINDWLAGALLVQEASGALSGLNGAEFDGRSGVMAGSPAICKRLLRLIGG